MTTLISSLLTYDEDCLSNDSLFKAVSVEAANIGVNVVNFAYLDNNEIYKLRLNVVSTITTEEGVKVSKAINKEGKSFILVDYLDIEGFCESKYFNAQHC